MPPSYNSNGESHEERQRCPEDHQGQGRQVRRFPLHGHQGQDAARDRGCELRRRRSFRRLRVRWLLDRRLEGHRSLRHDAEAGPAVGAHRSVLRADDDRHLLRRPRAHHRRALRARSARHRQEGRSLHEVARHRRHASTSAPKPSSSSSTTCASPPIRTTPASASTRPSCRPTPAPNTRWATSATARAPRAATSPCRRSTAARTSAPRCCP